MISIDTDWLLIRPAQSRRNHSFSSNPSSYLYVVLSFGDFAAHYYNVYLVFARKYLHSYILSRNVYLYNLLLFLSFIYHVHVVRSCISNFLLTMNLSYAIRTHAVNFFFLFPYLHNTLLTHFSQREREREREGERERERERERYYSNYAYSHRGGNKEEVKRNCPAQLHVIQRGEELINNN